MFQVRLHQPFPMLQEWVIVVPEFREVCIHSDDQVMHNIVAGHLPPEGHFLVGYRAFLSETPSVSAIPGTWHADCISVEFSIPFIHLPGDGFHEGHSRIVRRATIQAAYLSTEFFDVDDFRIVLNHGVRWNGVLLAHSLQGKTPKLNQDVDWSVLVPEQQQG